MPKNNDLLHEIIQEMQARHAGEDAMAIAASAINIWEQLAFKLVPKIGPGSIGLIYARSLELNSSGFPWLPAASQPGVAESPFTALKMSLEGRQPAEAVAANCALLNTFINLLATLIGVRLSVQFLRSLFLDDAPHSQENQK